MADTITGMRTEHTNLLKLLYVLQRQAEIFASGAKPAFDLMQDILDYLTNYFERVHHSKEEAMMSRLATLTSDAAQPVSRIRDEHEKISKLAHTLAGNLDNIIIGSDMTPRDTVVNMIMDFVNFNREHVRHEEQFVFPLAMQHLRESDWQEIEKSVPADDDPLFGEEVKSQYQNLYRSIVDAGSAGHA